MLLADARLLVRDKRMLLLVALPLASAAVLREAVEAAARPRASASLRHEEQWPPECAGPRWASLRRGLEDLRTAALPEADAANARWTEDLVRGIGLTPAAVDLPDPNATERLWYGDEAKFVTNLTWKASVHQGNVLPRSNGATPAVGIWQIPQQLSCTLNVLRRQHITSFLEIGTFSGWTSLVMHAYLQRYNPRLRTWTVDVQDWVEPCMKHLQSEYGVAAHIWNNTHAYSNKTDLRELPDLPKKVDLCFIDGEHTMSSIQHDYDELKGRCRITMFHDVANSLCPDAGTFWREKKVQKGAAAKECAYQPRGTEKMMGFGILLPEK